MVKSAPPAPETGRVGNLAETPLPTLLLSLARDGFEGWLTLERPGLSRRVRWRKGAPIELVSSPAEDSLRALLTERGQLSPAQAEKAAAVIEKKGASELQALAAAGIAPKDLLLGLAGALERALLDCMRWANGSFSLAFEPAPGAAPALPLSLPALVFGGVAASWRPDQVLVALGERATRFPTLAPDAAARLGAKLAKHPALQALIARLDGARSAFEALREARHAQAHAALWLLDASGLLTYGDAPAARADAPRPSGPEIEIVVAAQASGAGADPAREKTTAQRDPARQAAADELRREVTALHARLGDLDHWQLLGLERGASPADVKRAYLKAAKRLHPDHLMRLGLEDLKETANSVFTQIARAHEVLTDPDERARYEESQSGVSETEAILAAQAEQYFQRGEMLIRAGNFRGAAEFLDRAVKTYDREPDYHAAYGWALHRMNPPDNPRALGHFEKALELSGEQAQTLLRMSLVLKELGDEPRSAQLAARARSLDANVRA